MVLDLTIVYLFILLLIGDYFPIFSTMSQNIAEIYEQKEHYGKLKEMLLPYMFLDRSGDESGYAYAQYPGYGFQKNERIKKLAKTWNTLINGIENIDEQQRELGVTYMR